MRNVLAFNRLSPERNLSPNCRLRIAGSGLQAALAAPAPVFEKSGPNDLQRLISQAKPGAASRARRISSRRAVAAAATASAHLSPAPANITRRDALTTKPASLGDWHGCSRSASGHPRTISAFDVVDGKTLASGRIFCDMGNGSSGGIRVDITATSGPPPATTASTCSRPPRRRQDRRDPPARRRLQHLLRRRQATGCS